jgi:hypothetical protein
LRLRRLKFVREQFFLGSGCAEHQATGAVPQPTDKPCCVRYCLAEAREEKLRNVILIDKRRSGELLFQHPRLFTALPIAADSEALLSHLPAFSSVLVH